MPKTPSEFDEYHEQMNKPIGQYAEDLAKQGKQEGRLVMHDDQGAPVAALVLITGDVEARLKHLDRFVQTTERYFKRALPIH